MAKWLPRLTTNQEIPGSTPGRLVHFIFFVEIINPRFFVMNLNAIRLDCVFSTTVDILPANSNIKRELDAETSERRTNGFYKNDE